MIKYFFEILCIASMTLILSSCSKETGESNSTVEPKAGNEAAVDALFAGSCPYLTKDSKGNIALSWIREINDTQRVMCYAVSTDKGKTFETPVVISGSENVSPHGENMPKIIFKPDGSIIALWGTNNPNPENPYSGLVYYSQSFDDGKSWSKPATVSRDTSSIDQRYFDVALLPGGQAAVVWLDARTETNKEGSTLYYAVENGTGSFENEKPIGETCCQCCRTSLFVDSKENIHVTYRDIINDSIRDMVHSVSADGGRTFSPAKRISDDNWVIRGCPHSGPGMVENTNGLNFVWHTMGSGRNSIFYCQSVNNGKDFSQRDIVSNDQTARHPQIAALGNGNLLVAWDEMIKSGDDHNSRVGLQYRNADGSPLQAWYITADTVISTFPVLTVIDDNNVLVAYTQRTEAPANAGDMNMKDHNMHGMDKTSGSNIKDHVVYQVVSVK